MFHQVTNFCPHKRQSAAKIKRFVLAGMSRP
jgi:hypothetical protein